MSESLWIAGIGAGAGTVVGTVLGVLVRGAVEHRGWLRDRRHDTYAAFLHANDQLERSASNYVWTLSLLVGAGYDDPSLRQQLTSDAESAWETHKHDRQVADQRMAEVELLASGSAAQAANMCRAKCVLGVPLLPLPSELEDEERRDDLYAECRDWEDRTDARRAVRQRFVEAAKEDLGTNPFRTGSRFMRPWRWLTARWRIWPRSK